MAEFKFGKIEFNVTGKAGFFTMSETLKNKIQALTKEDARQVNKEAWVMKKSRTAIMNKYNNVTTYGHELYDAAYTMYIIADAVAKESYKRMLKD